MGGSRGLPVAPSTPAATTPATPQLVNRGAGMSTLPVSPAGPTGLPSTSNKGGGSSIVPATPPPPPPTSSLPLSTSNKGGGSAAIPSPTFASDPVVAQPLPTPVQSNKGGGITSPLTPAPTSPFTGLASIPLSPYGSTGYTSPGPQVDVTELSRTNFDDELTARDTLRRLESIEERFAKQDAAAASAEANAPSAAERKAQELRDFDRRQRAFWASQDQGQ